VGESFLRFELSSSGRVLVAAPCCADVAFVGIRSSALSLESICRFYT
jgi:hypothetical protein